MTDLEHLLAIEAIKKLKSRYFRTMDLRQWDEMLTLFTEDAKFDVNDALSPPEAPRSTEPPIVGAKKFVEYVKEGMTAVISVHHGHMPEINILSENRAEGYWSLEDWLYTPTGNFHGQGHYYDTYVKMPDGWRIASTRITRLYIKSEL